MGREYKLRFRHDDGAEVIAALERLQDAVPVSGLELAFRGATNPSTMPDALLRAEPYGLYFCDNGGAGRDYLGRVVTKLLGSYGAVTVEDLE